MFGVKSVEETTMNWIKPGINENVVCAGLSIPEGEVKTPHLILSFHLEGDEDNTRDERLYFTDAATKHSLKKLIHLVKVYNTREDLERADEASKSEEEFCKNVNLMIKGKKYRMKFTGEQYENSEGEIKTSTKLGFPPFAESVEISKEDSELVFDKNNKFDFSTIEPATTEVGQESISEESSDDLPF